MAITYDKADLTRDQIHAVVQAWGALPEPRPDKGDYLVQEIVGVNWTEEVVQGDELRSVISAVLSDWDSYV